MTLRERLARIISKWPCHIDGFDRPEGFSTRACQEWQDTAFKQADEILAAIGCNEAFIEKASRAHSPKLWAMIDANADDDDWNGSTALLARHTAMRDMSAAIVAALGEMG